MSDPWSPKGAPRRSNEVRDPLTFVRVRLRSLGATADEVDEWTGTEGWDDLDAEQRESVTDLRSASDDEIRFQIEAVRGGEETEEDLEQGGEGTVAVGVDEPGISPEVDAIAHDRIENEATGDGTGEALPSLPDSAYPPDAEQVTGEMTRGPVPDDVDGEQIPQEGDEEEAVTLPADLLGENVPEILEWVDGDPAKASIVLGMESLTDKPRKTLVEPLREITGGAAG